MATSRSKKAAPARSTKTRAKAPQKASAAKRTLDDIEELMRVVSLANEGDYTEEIEIDEDSPVGGLADNLKGMLTNAADQAEQSADHTGQVEAINRSQAVIEFELDGTIITANDNFLGAVGYSLEEVQGQHHRMFVDAAYANTAEYKQFWADLARGEYKAAEFCRYRKDGQAIWIQASYNPILDADGKPFKVVKYATDVTEAKLRAADYEGQMDAVSKAQAVIEFNLDGTIITANENFLATLGYSLDEIQGKHHSMFVEPGYASSIEYRQFWEDLNRGQFSSGEYLRLGKGGNEIWIQASYNPICDMNGNPFKVVKYASDVTETKQKAFESERVQSMLDEAPFNILFADTDLILRYVNPASIRTLETLKQYLPMDPKDLVGVCIDRFHKNPEVQRRILADPTNLPLEKQIQLGPETLQLNVSPVMDASGEYLGAMVNWEVITERLQMEQQIKEQHAAERAKAEAEQLEAQETQRKVDAILTTVNAVAEGHFDVEVPDLGDDAVGQVATALGRAVESIRSALQNVESVSMTVASAAQQMTGSSAEISKGAQRQAARLEETASSLEEITATVKQNSENAQQARQLANGSRDVAESGGQVVGKAVEAMGEINDSSKKISDIITTIDEIAFQTNLLALNAAVEAARAGEQGRGFAVVAAEVRNLAQRSASAAKEIKSLIQDSVSKVEKGTDLVNDSGKTLGEIVDSVKRVTDIVAEIAAASQEQLTGIEMVNNAVSEMDRVTQASANQTEEMSGTSSSLLNHAQQLSSLVGQFSLGTRTQQPAMAAPPAMHQAPPMQMQAMPTAPAPQWNAGSNQILESIDSQIQPAQPADANDFIEF